MLLSSSSGAERSKFFVKERSQTFPNKNTLISYTIILSLSLLICLCLLVNKENVLSISARDETCFSNREEGGTREKREAQTSAGFLMETDER